MALAVWHFAAIFAGATLVLGVSLTTFCSCFRAKNKGSAKRIAPERSSSEQMAGPDGRRRRSRKHKKDRKEKKQSKRKDKNGGKKSKPARGGSDRSVASSRSSVLRASVVVPDVDGSSEVVPTQPSPTGTSALPMDTPPPPPSKTSGIRPAVRACHDLDDNCPVEKAVADAIAGSGSPLLSTSLRSHRRSSSGLSSAHARRASLSATPVRRVSNVALSSTAPSRPMAAPTPEKKPSRLRSSSTAEVVAPEVTSKPGRPRGNRRGSALMNLKAELKEERQDPELLAPTVDGDASLSATSPAVFPAGRRRLSVGMVHNIDPAVLKAATVSPGSAYSGSPAKARPRRGSCLAVPAKVFLPED